MSEIEELLDDEDQHQPHHTNKEEEEEEEEEEECIYVGVGEGDTSMGALSWTLSNLVTPSSTTLYLIHVFPEVNHIPNPLGVGMIEKSKVSGEHVESYMAQERDKRRQLLNKFLHYYSSSSFKVKRVDTILIESDFIAKAILDLIPILHITNLVIGSASKNLRKSRSRKGNNGSIAGQILQNAPESCKVRIICEGKELNDEQMKMMMRLPNYSPLQPSPTPHTSAVDDDTSSMSKKEEQHQQYHDLLVSCICFKPKFR